jgi:hypothetical protein
MNFSSFAPEIVNIKRKNMEIIKKNININLVKALENYVSVIVIETIWKTIFLRL